MAISKIIHHIAPEDQSSWHPIWKRCRDSFIVNFPDYEHKLWNDHDDIDSLVYDHYKEFWDLYNSFPHHIMRIDFARLCILHQYGGIYADMDYYCYKNFQEYLTAENIFLHNTSALYTTSEYENCLMSSQQGSEFLVHVMNNVKHWFVHHKHLLNVNTEDWRSRDNDYAINNTTGSGILSACIKSFGHYFSIEKFPAINFNQDPIVYNKRLIGRHLHSSLWGEEYLNHSSRECFLIRDGAIWNCDSGYVGKDPKAEYWQNFDFHKNYADTGIVVLAQNNAIDDYISQACLLAMSVKVTNPNLPISIVTDDSIDDEYKYLFDKIIPIPFGDSASNSEWKVENRWKIYKASPYWRTIVMDVDMLLLQDISDWLDFLTDYKLYFPCDVKTYDGKTVTSDFYRNTFTANELPNTYVGFHYFEKGEAADKFYKWVELVVKNWELYYEHYAKEVSPTSCSMDITVSIVIKILNCLKDVTSDNVEAPTFTHMKPMIQNWDNPRDSWQDCVEVNVDDDCSIKIGDYIQTGILHYTEQSFAKNHKLLELYRDYLSV